MGHDDRERRRLALQASIINPFAERLLQRSGITSGMHVIDIGCGVGEVSMLVARLVGRHGRVIGIDFDDGALTIARERSRAQGLNNVTFLHEDVRTYRPSSRVDAICGRHILIHTPDPSDLLRTVFSILSPGGVAVFQEFDFAAHQPAYPEAPLREKVFAIFREFFCKYTHGNMGARLYHLLLEAGFSAPDGRAEFPIDGGADSPFYEWIAESMQSILTRVEAAGIATADEIGIDTLAERLRQEAVSLRSCFPGPVMVGCFARKT